MNAELLYTSAPHGLKQGSRGFCTVLSTVGMPLNLATKLESLSGYRHLYPSGTPDASKNPVSFSHLRFTVGGRQISVLSRISDYGLDYSQRTNKLAHHIVVDGPMPACGPAALLAESGVMRDHWDGQCVNVPSAPALPALSAEPGVCRTWESITGDAGWGGVVANAWLSSSPRPVFILFGEDQSTELLVLIHESLALLPSNKRWQATFGTYVTTLPPDVECRVRCVVSGSDEARMASARGTVIDLTSPLGQAASSDAVDAARKGVIIGASSLRQHEIIPDIVPDFNSNDNSIEQIAPEMPSTIDDQSSINLQLSNNHPNAPPALTIRKNNESPNTNCSNHSTRNKGRLIIASLFAAILLIGMTTGIIFLKSQIDEFSSISRNNDISKEALLAENQSEQNSDNTRVPENPQKNDPKHPTLAKNTTQSEKNEKRVQESNNEHPASPIAGVEPRPQETQKSDAVKPKKDKRLSPSKISLKTTGFMLDLPNETEGKNVLQIRAGIPKAKINAQLVYESDDDNEKSKFQEFIMDSSNVEWRWFFSSDNGTTWTEFQERKTSALVIRPNDPPNSLLRVEVIIPANGDLFESHPTPLKHTFVERIADYMVVKIPGPKFAASIQSRSHKNLEIDLTFPDIFPKDYKIYFVDATGSKSPKKLASVILKNIEDRSKQTENIAYFDAISRTRSSLQNINTLRAKFKTTLKNSSDDFKNICMKFEMAYLDPWNPFFEGQKHLREQGANQIGELSLMSNWDPKQFVQWFRNESKREEAQDIPPNSPGLIYNNIAFEVFKKNFKKEGDLDRTTSKDFDDIQNEHQEFVISKSLVFGPFFNFPLPIGGIQVFSETDPKKPVIDIALWIRIQVDNNDRPVASGVSAPGAGAPVFNQTSTNIDPPPSP